jgi:membrane-associated phospholipid phosphatase
MVRAVGMVALTLAMLLSRPLGAQEAAGRTKPAHRLKWRWRRANVVDYAAIAVIGGAYLYSELVMSQGTEPRWTGGVLFDDGARDAFRARSADGRVRAGRWSDYLSLAAPAVALFDTLVIPLADDGNWDVLWQMSVIDLEAASVSGLLTRWPERTARRARPDLAECEKDPNYDNLCFRGETASFPSGHTSSAFTAAGLVCAHHAHLALYGGGAPDVAACIGTSSFALTTGVLRLMADRHYASDVLVGAMVGAGAGFALPMLWGYSNERPSNDAASFVILPLASPGVIGMGAHGRF